MHDGQSKNISFSEFSKIVMSNTPEEKDKVYYIDEYAFASPNPAMIAKDWKKPSFMTSILKSKSTAVSVWFKDFERRPKYNGNREKYICLLSGEEQFRIVGPAYKQNLYAGGKEYGQLAPDEIPLDLFDYTKNGYRNKEEFPLADDVHIMETDVLKGGSCIFIPAFNYYQSRSRDKGVGRAAYLKGQAYIKKAAAAAGKSGGRRLHETQDEPAKDQPADD